MIVLRGYKYFIVFALFLLYKPLKAQVVVVTPYPSSAQAITRAIGTSKLTVRIAFASSCSNDTVTIKLPQSVNYIAGSVVKTLGSQTISEADISDLRVPRFKINDVVTNGDITFTIEREAGCGVLSNGKDTVVISGSCGSYTENISNINTYNLLAPSISLNPPAVIVNAIIGQTANRKVTITNGGNGDLDTIYYHVTYFGGGIENTDFLNKVTANGVSFAPYKTSGDTLFYKFYGDTLFSGDSLLANGEVVSITEPIKILQCNAMTEYSAGWGVNSGQICSLSKGYGNIAMAGGVSSLTSITAAFVGYVDKCTPYDINFTMTNGGTGNDTSAGMFNVTIWHGYSYPGRTIRAYPGSIVSHTNGRINGNVISSFSNSGDTVKMDLNNLFPTSGPDPDGVGGLADLDGDGYYDDLPRGEKVVYTLKTEWNCNISCNVNKVYYSGGRIEYTDMCGNAKLSSSVYSYRPIYESSFTGKAHIPANIFGGQPFTLQLKEGHYINSSYNDNVNTRYQWRFILPSGYSVSGSGNPMYGTSSSTYSQSGDTIIITSLTNSLQDASIDLVLTCGSSGSVTINYFLQKIDNTITNCSCQGNLICASVNAVVFCPGPCSSGPSNQIPKVRRIDNSLGWTNSTMAVRQSDTAISDYDLSKALFLDTIQISGSAIQNDSAVNLYLQVNLGKAGSVNKLKPVDIIAKIYRTGSLISIDTIFSAVDNSIGSLQIMDWNISSSLPSAGLLPKDSIVTISRYMVATNVGLAQNDVQSGGRFFNYNIVSGVKKYCFDPVPEMYLVGTHLVDGRNGFYTSGCNVTALGGSGSNLARRFNTSGELYANEYRPVFYIDSVVIRKPQGYDLVSLTNNIGGGTLIPNYIIGDDYTYKNPGTWSPIPLTVTNTYGASFRYSFQPTCKSAFTATHGIKFYIKDYYYAFAGDTTNPYPSLYTYVLGGGSANIASQTGFRNQTISYSTSQKPILVSQNLTGDVLASKLQETWDIEIRNDGLSTAGYHWVALEKTFGTGITIDSVVRVSTQTKLVRNNFGSGDSWYQVSATGIASSGKETIRIFFKYSNCYSDSIRVYSGWNCSAYPSPDPIGDANACDLTSLYVKVLPIQSQVQLSVMRQPGNGSSIPLCTVDSILLQVNSAQSAAIINPTVDVYLPIGITFTLPFQIEYPYNSGNYQNASSTVISGGYRVDLTSHSGIGVNGIPGTSTSSSAVDRQAKIKIIYNSDCDFVSGAAVRFLAHADRPCGEEAIGNKNVSSDAINIQGVIFNGLAGLTFTLPVDTFNCNQVRTLSLSTTPVLAPSQAGDTIIYTLPNGLNYKGNFVAGTNCTNCTVTTSNGFANSTIVKIKLDTGVAANTVMSYSFDVLAESSGECDSSEIIAQAKRIISPLSCGSILCSSSSAIISSKSKVIYMQRPDLSFNSLIGQYHDYHPNDFTYSYTASIKNEGLSVSNGDTTFIQIFLDENNNQRYDSGDTLISKYYYNKSIANGQSISFTDTFSYGAVPDASKSIFAVINANQSPNCNCTDTTVSPMLIGLPVELINFKASQKEAEILLTWQTVSENNSDFIEVYRAIEGEMDFTKTGEVKARGNSHTIVNYLFVDNVTNLWGKALFYRLKLVDIDGQFFWSETRKVDFSAADNDILIYPNPAADIISIVFVNGPKKFNIDIINMLGATVAHSEAKSGYGMDVSMLDVGQYFVKISTANKVYFRRITLVR